MSQLALRIFILYSIVFTSQKLLDVFLGGLASPIKLLLILALWFIVFAFYWQRLTNQERSLADICLMILVFVMVFAVSLSYLVHQIPLVIIVYIAISYLSFYPLIYLIIYLKRRPQYFKKLLSFSVFLCLIISLGIVFDSSGGLFKTPIIGSRLEALEQAKNKSEIYQYRGEQRRGSFFMESSTIVFPVLATGFLCLTVQNSLFDRQKIKFFNSIWFNSIVIWIGCFFTLSRTPLFLISAMIFYLFAKSVRIGTTKKLLSQICFVILILAIFLTSSQLQSYLYKQLDSSAVEAFESGISAKEAGNFRRFKAWGDGLALFSDGEAWLGKGLGTSRVGLEDYLGNQAEYHYESSLLSSFSEAGIFGIITETLPLLVVIYIVIRKKVDSVFLVWAILFAVNIFAAPITAYSTMFSRYLGMGLCIAYIIPDRLTPKPPRKIYQQ